MGKKKRKEERYEKCCRLAFSETDIRSPSTVAFSTNATVLYFLLNIFPDLIYES